MATIQKRKSRGKYYWSIVESRRVNGKPRPVIVEYLGSTASLINKLTSGEPHRIRSYSHGAVSVLFDMANELRIAQIINANIPKQQVRSSLSVGESMLMAAIGRVCYPTSKKSWFEKWAKTTSLQHCLKINLKKITSQHFWDQMDALPEEAIPKIEAELIKEIVSTQKIKLDTLFCDTTNFFTYIDSENKRCNIAQRGKNKQKRSDLRQVGMLLLVSKEDKLPLFHSLYTGNLNDKTVFSNNFQNMILRIKELVMSLEQITLVFDQGNNSKKMLKDVGGKVSFVGAISPHYQKDLIDKANSNFKKISIGKKREINVYREKKEIWGQELTTVVYISPKLKSGQTKGLELLLKKALAKIKDLQERIKIPKTRGKKRTKSDVDKKMTSIVNRNVLLKKLITWKVTSNNKGCHYLKFEVDEKELLNLKENKFGRRILITNRHLWKTHQIIKAYRQQNNAEYAFRTFKNPFNIALRPQYHWTEQKIKVHAFICMLASVLMMTTHRKAKRQMAYKGSPQSLIRELSSIRLATYIKKHKIRGEEGIKIETELEEADKRLQLLIENFNIRGDVLKKTILS